LKKAEDSNDLVFRFYEFEGKPTDVRLRLPEAAVSASETNLMEGNKKPISLHQSDNELNVPTGPYEIKTVSVSFSSPQK
jgi:alpha-mannosidase